MSEKKKKDEHREPEHFISIKTRCSASYLSPCVFSESFRRDLNEAKLGGWHFRILSHLPFCKYDASITSQVSSNVFNY